MVITDPLGDMFVRIRNAQAVGKTTVCIPHSKLKAAVAEKLKGAGYIKEVSKRGKKISKSIEITLLYEDNSNPKILGIKRVSKPSRRIYLPFKDIHSVKQGEGSMIISTPKGIMTDREARRQKVGGEIICKIW